MSVFHPDRQVKNDLARAALIALGWLAVAAGVAGIFLPLVPTVPFLLLAAACFARSSARFHAWLVDHNYLGPLVRDYLNGTGIPARVRLTAVGMVWVSFPTSALFFARATWLRLVLVAIAIGITLYLFSLPTASGDGREDGKDSPVE